MFISSGEDQDPPTFSFTTGTEVIDWLLGTPFQLPTGFVTATDNLDGNITASIIFGDLDLIDENQEGNQTIPLAVSDAAGNMAADSITVSFQQPSFSLNGVAIDGYLNGASVVFRPTNPSMSNNLFYGTTDSQGGFKLDFLANEFALVDTNGNGLIDPEEGMIEVSGGVDTVTNRIFEGTLKADGGAAVVTPLTTVIAEMVNQGTTKEDAMSLMVDAFGLPPSLDVTNYDPIKNASEGSSDAALVLQSGAVVANIFKQTEQLAKSAGVDVSKNNVSLAVAQEIGALLKEENVTLLDFTKDDFVKDLVTDSVAKVDSNTQLDSSDVNEFTQLLSSSNKILSDENLQNLDPQQMLKTISQRQVAIEEEIIVSMQDIVEGKTTFTILNQNITESLLIDVANLQVGVNQFVPQGQPLDLTVIYTNYNTGDEIANLEILDGDGDSVTVSLLSGNSDKDGDTNKPFG